MNTAEIGRNSVEVTPELSDDYATQPSGAETRDELRQRQIRADVESVLALYVSLDPFTYRCPEGTLVQSGVGSSGARLSEGALQAWKLTIGAKLARVSRACGMCAPTGKRCQHVAAALTVARLRVLIEQQRQNAHFYDREIGSATRRKRLGAEVLRDYKTRRAAALRFVESNLPERRRIAQTMVYADGLELIYLACCETEATRRYCFREPFAEDAA